MAVVPINFGIQSNPGRYGEDGTGVLTNCYAEARGNEGKSTVTIYASQGLDLFANEASATKGTRGLFPLGDSFYWVVDRQLRKVDTTGNHVFIGGLPDDGRVTIAQNTRGTSPQIVIVTQGGLPFLLEDDVLSPLGDPDLPPPIAVDFLGGYMLYLLSSGVLFYSELNDAGNIDPLNFIEAEADPDGGKALKVIGNYAYVFGDKTIQPFQNTGGTDNPLTPLLGGLVQRGCLAGGTVTEFDNSALWVADDGTVRRLSGSVPQKISTHYVDELIRKETDPDNMTGDRYSMQGHEFYVLSGTNFTVVYDAATGLWHDRKSIQIDRWRGQSITQFGDKWICGDHLNGNLYEIDADTFDENGEDMVMSIQSPLVHNSPNRLQYNTLWLDFVTGVGLNSTDVHDSDPQVMLRFSDDGGFEWSNQRTRPLGKIGQRGVRVKFNKLGTEKFKGRTFEVSVSAHVARAFVQAHGDLMQVAS